jgi:hypothetical protein
LPSSLFSLSMPMALIMKSSLQYISLEIPVTLNYSPQFLEKLSAMLQGSIKALSAIAQTSFYFMLCGCHPLVVRWPESNLQWPINDIQRLQKSEHPTGDNKIGIRINFRFHPFCHMSTKAA